MENWIRNLDSFYVTKDDQKISIMEQKSWIQRI